MSDSISRQYASVRIHDVLSPFRTSSSTAQITAAVQETLTFINLFLPSDVENQPAFFISQLSHYDSDERMELHDQAVAAAEEMSEWLEKCEARNLNSVSCKSLFAAMGVEHQIKKAEQRMYLHFRLDPSIATLLKSYVTAVRDRLLIGARNAPRAVTPDARIVLVGVRDWAGLTLYEQAQVVLAARRYQIWISAAARRKNSHVASVAADHQARLLTSTLQPVQASLGHSHSPSLTGRQERRNGVEQAELRERWSAPQ